MRIPEEQIKTVVITTGPPESITATNPRHIITTSPPSAGFFVFKKYGAPLLYATA